LIILKQRSFGMAGRKRTNEAAATAAIRRKEEE
jgi:hypothetical protein